MRRLLENRNEQTKNLKDLTFPSRKIRIDSRFQMSCTVSENQLQIFSQEKKKILHESAIMRKKKLWKKYEISFG